MIKKNNNLLDIVDIVILLKLIGYIIVVNVIDVFKDLITTVHS